MAQPTKHKSELPRVASAADLFRLASHRVVRRGLAYARGGRVTALSTVNGRLEARVEGTRSEPYLVRLEHDAEEFLSSCTCPFDWEPFCKHAIAALAVYGGLHQGLATAGVVAPETETESAEIQVRRERGRKENFRIRRREGSGYFGVYEVSSGSGATYEIEIRSLTQRCNRCSCPDHASSDLGTCKHIEAVLAALGKRGRRAFTTACRRPPAASSMPRATCSAIHRGTCPICWPGRAGSAT